MPSPDSRLQHVLAAGAAERRRQVPIGAGPPTQRRRVGEFVSVQLGRVLGLDMGAQRTQAMDALEVVAGLANELSDDAAEVVFAALAEGECRSVGRLCSTNKALAQLCHDDAFWRRLCTARDWDSQALGPQETWKDRFVARCLQEQGGGFPRPPTRLERARAAAEAAAEAARLARTQLVGHARNHMPEVLMVGHALTLTDVLYNQGRMVRPMMLAAGVPRAVIEVYVAFLRSRAGVLLTAGATV